MNENQTYEFVVAEKSEGVRKLKKILARGGMLAVIAVFVILFTVVFPALAPVAILPLSFLGVVLYFWKYFNVDLEYSMTSGYITFTRIYGGKSKKKVLDLSIKDMQAIAPVTDATAAELTAKGVEKSYMFASHSKASDVYYAIFEKDGRKCVVYFEATQRALQIFRFYNMVTVVTQVAR